MHQSSPHYFPIGLPFLLILVALFAAAILLIELRVLQYASERIGLDRRVLFGVLLLSLLGSYINIPVARLRPERVASNQIVTVFGVQYVVPEVEEWPGTLLAVNVGGAVIPILLSIYLIVHNGKYLRSLAAVAIVALVVHLLAKPSPGVGIVVPTLLPAIAAATVAMLLSRDMAPAVAYVSGTLGTLIGADLLNLDKIQGLHAPVASIGGAGTFDGVFLTGLLAVLLA